MKSQGLGDTVKKVLEKVGFVSCKACEERRRYLNNLFPYLDPNPTKGVMTARQKRLWKAFEPATKRTLNNDEMDLIQHIYCELFHVNINPCRNCGGSSWKTLIDKIDNVYTNNRNK